MFDVFIKSDLWVTEKVFIATVQSSAASKIKFERLSLGKKESKPEIQKMFKKLRERKTQFYQTVATVGRKTHKTHLNYYFKRVFI